VVDRLGIGYQAIEAINQKLFTLDFAFGQNGPYRDRPGCLWGNR
jgi:crotonobetainyl-CoA:carnitine CoA-transferase CaiB-like acyl-CoA transferase